LKQTKIMEAKIVKIKIKSGAIAGLIAGAIGTTFSGSSGGSGGNEPATTANTGAAAATPQGPSAMSSKMPIIHSIIAGAVTAMALGSGEVRAMLEKMTSKMEDMHKDAELKKKCDENPKNTWDAKTKTCTPPKQDA